MEDVDDDAEVGEEAPRTIKSHDAKNMAHDMLDFLMDNQDQPICSSLTEMARHIEEQLQQVTHTARHEQRSITDFYRML